MGPKVLLVVIDAATPHVVCPAIHTGALPVLRQLVDAGAMHERSTSIFPSITPAAATSIVTGCYPSEHGISGASWFDEARQEIAYYGEDFWVIAREGFGEFIRDFLLRLNGDRLTAPTMFEMVERTGRTAACLNYFVFRGTAAHRVEIPGLLAALPGVPFRETVEGPSILALGDFVGSRTRRGSRIAGEGGLFQRFGMDDASTGAMLRDLMAKESLPDFTVAYFADNDYRSHQVGPHGALPVVGRVDRMLGEAFEAAGGLDAVLRDTFVIVTSDHGHCDVLGDAARAVVPLPRLLADFRQATLGRPWRRNDEVMICPNMRAAQIYFRAGSDELRDRVVADVLSDERVDLALWRSGGADPLEAIYTIARASGTLQFRRGTQAQREGMSAEDEFGGPWTWWGDPDVIGLDCDGDRVLFQQYPNAFERITGALDLPQSGDIWVTARPGCEFEAPGSTAHVGGASHGALHALDSYCPVVAAGPARVPLPREMRSIDIAPLCMALLGVPMRYGIGQSRTADGPRDYTAPRI